MPVQPERESERSMLLFYTLGRADEAAVDEEAAYHRAVCHARIFLVLVAPLKVKGTRRERSFFLFRVGFRYERRR